MRAARQIAIFLIFVIAIILLLSLFFGRTNRTNKSAPANFSVLKYIEKDSKVVATTDGSINGDDAHRAIRITVSPSKRQIDVIQGYQGTVIKTQSFTNNQQAYDEFLHALDKAGYGKTRKSSVATEDGVCATGRRFVFEVFDNDKSVSRTWTANCMKGNTIATPAKVSALFRAQITDYESVVEGQSY